MSIRTQANPTHTKTNHHNSTLTIPLQSVIPMQFLRNRLTRRPGNIEQGQGALKSHDIRPLKGGTPHDHRLTTGTPLNYKAYASGQSSDNSIPKPNLVSIQTQANSAHTKSSPLHCHNLDNPIAIGNPNTIHVQSIDVTAGEYRTRTARSAVPSTNCDGIASAFRIPLGPRPCTIVHPIHIVP